MLRNDGERGDKKKKKRKDESRRKIYIFILIKYFQVF